MMYNVKCKWLKWWWMGPKCLLQLDHLPFIMVVSISDWGKWCEMSSKDALCSGLKISVTIYWNDIEEHVNGTQHENIAEIRYSWLEFMNSLQMNANVHYKYTKVCLPKKDFNTCWTWWETLCNKIMVAAAMISRTEPFLLLLKYYIEIVRKC